MLFFIFFLIFMLHLAVVCTGTGMLPLALWAEGQGQRKNSALLYKLAKQLTTLAVPCLLYTVLVLIVGTAFFLQHEYLIARLVGTAFFAQITPYSILSFCCFTGFVLLFLVYVLKRKGPDGGRRIRLLAGFSGTVFLLASLFFSLLFKYTLLLHFIQGRVTGTPLLTLGYWLFLLVCFCLLFSYSASSGLVFALWRRRYTDYGRDYYGYIIPWLARKIVPGCVMLLCLQGWFIASFLWDSVADVVGQGYTGTNMLLLGTLLFPLLACVLWSLVALVARPLQYKPAVFAAVVCWWLAVPFMGIVNTVIFFYYDIVGI